MLGTFILLLFSTDTATTHIYTLSLHDALPILRALLTALGGLDGCVTEFVRVSAGALPGREERLDRKSTRLNSSHVAISYAVFCLKKKNRDHKKDKRIKNA